RRPGSSQRPRGDDVATEGRSRSWWGWGWSDEALTDDECSAQVAGLGGPADAPLPVPGVADLDLPTPRVSPPDSLAPFCSSDPLERAGHTYGKAFRDVVRALHGDVSSAPDVVARPRSEDDVVAVLDWAGDADVAVVPYG